MAAGARRDDDDDDWEQPSEQAGEDREQSECKWDDALNAAKRWVAGAGGAGDGEDVESVGAVQSRDEGNQMGAWAGDDDDGTPETPG
ncbi:hypothetical protein O9K51_06366 [Purpureocillium lavendulum]|uniref:Uncharacterized protein n=1 Tax=Purpureocillium lavendulum TaxID=1247861 RepID=A0AB34FQC8_9HYPO|nr:hypothetical protein O9K51_06366 [Purpureocillium lavendulum]